MLLIAGRRRRTGRRWGTPLSRAASACSWCRCRVRLPSCCALTCQVACTAALKALHSRLHSTCLSFGAGRAAAVRLLPGMRDSVACNAMARWPLQELHPSLKNPLKPRLPQTLQGRASRWTRSRTRRCMERKRRRTASWTSGRPNAPPPLTAWLRCVLTDLNRNRIRQSAQQLGPGACESKTLQLHGWLMGLAACVHLSLILLLP